jgi:hypothetical protein
MELEDSLLCSIDPDAVQYPDRSESNLHPCNQLLQYRCLGHAKESKTETICNIL